MTAPAAVAWGGRLGLLNLAGTPLGFLASAPAAWLLLAGMVGELIMDKLPVTPSRTLPGPFGGRIVAGGLAGAGLAAGTGHSIPIGVVAGILGAVVGTLGGYRLRTGLVRRLAVPDYVIAIAEDIVAVGGAILILSAA